MLETRISGPAAVIGDVHGQTEKLETLLNQLDARGDLSRRWIVFIGDLVDRGPDPAGTLDLICGLARDGVRVAVVSGNHELAMGGALGLLPAPEYCDWRKRWLSNYGAETTFASYGVPFGDCEALVDAMPPEHRRLLTDAPWSVEHDQFFFVHAGLDPHLPFAAQKNMLRARDYSLNNPGWLCSKRWAFEPLPRDCDRTVVSGHVPLVEVQFEPQRILVDTTGGVEGELSCVLLPERAVLTSRRPTPIRKPAFSLARMFGLAKSS
jgi:serine/threonine protein phosphatase 1